ncbi:MAG: response regulator transcription factor [Tissierellales bacterium]|jgi:DNA-binding response OmpR family regulator|nr:response regulator transcription factor [Tissierellales bacterium]
MGRIFILEDDEGLSRGIGYTFSKDGHEVEYANSINQAISKWTELRDNDIDIDIMLLDRNLPDGDGISFCQRVREESDVPILMLTAKDLELDEIVGLESGADDYITKPFSIAVLKLKVEKWLERSSREVMTDEENESILKSGLVKMDTKKMCVYLRNEPVNLSSTEYKLLKYFLENANQVLIRDQILDRLWDNDGQFVDDNTLAVNIRRLRQKIEKSPSKPEYIKTIRGMGYMWVEK